MTDSIYKVALFGCGSLGANTAIAISRRLGEQVFFYLFDRDIIELKNLANQPWVDVNIGQKKSTVLTSYLWHTSKVKAVCYHQNIQNINDVIRSLDKSQKKIDLLIDCFDNIKSRKIIRDVALYYNIHCIHSGFSEKSLFIAKSFEFPLFGDEIDSREPICDRRELANIVQIGSGFTSLAATEYLINNKHHKYFFEIINGQIFSYFTGSL